MNRAVLDSSILLKSIFNPLRSLSDEVYARELETHGKCRMLLMCHRLSPPFLREVPSVHMGIKRLTHANFK